MGIIKRIGQAITDIGERTERASASTLSGIGNRSRSHTIRRKIDTLRVPKVNMVDSAEGSVRVDEPAPIVIPTKPVEEVEQKEVPQDRFAQPMNTTGESPFDSMLQYYEGKKAKSQTNKVDYLSDELQFLNG
tara:strand:- start:268 stop:663 length:396 start_codon:yes stop_codon:yes gene_type:complete